MKKRYCLAVLILLIISSTAMTASASQMDRWSTSRYSNANGYDGRQESNQMAQTQSQVTLILYVLDGGINGKALPGVDVTVYDAEGNSFGGVTDSKGAVALEGQPGTWTFSLAKEGYKTSDLKYGITRSQVGATYLLKAPQSAPSKATPEPVTYPQEAAESAQAGEIAQTAQAAQPAQPEPVSLKIDVYETDLNGTALSGVQITGQDAAGNSFEGATDSDGSVTLTGQPGTWAFSFAKAGYETLNLNYSVMQTEEVAAYLQKTAQSEFQNAAQTVPQSQGPEPIDFTVYVHEGSLNGTALSGVQVTGGDASGNSFEGITDSNGTAVLSGQPGTWAFSFAKAGYKTLNLNYNVTQTDYGDVYLQSAEQPTQGQVPVVSEVVPSQAYQLSPSTSESSTQTV